MRRQLVPPVAILLALSTAAAEIPNTIPHQGRVAVSNINYHGSAGFKFLLFEDDDTDHSNGGEVALWANDSNSGVAFAEPAAAVVLTVERGLYATQLGGPGTVALPGSIEPSAGRKLYLRIWFDGGTGAFQALSPEIEIGSVPLALHSRAVTAGGVGPAALADGAVTSAKIADAAVGSAKIAAGAVSALGTPDGTTADALQVTDGGGIGVGTPSPVAGLHVATATPLLLPAVQAVLTNGVDGFDALDGPGGVASSGNLLAVASSVDDSVSLIDITDPAAPALESVITDGAGGFDQLDGASAVAFSGSFLAVGAYEDDSVTIIDVSDPANPVPVHVISDGAGGFDDLDGVIDLAFAPGAGGLLAVVSELDDSVTLVDDPLVSPSVAVTMKDGQFGFDDLDGARSLAFNGDLMAVAAAADDSVSLIDISAASNPVLRAVMRDGTGGFDHLDGATGVAFNGSLLAVAAVDDGAVTLVETGTAAATTTTLLATLQDGLDGFGALEGARVAVFNGDLMVVVSSLADSLTFVDVADPTNPVLEAAIRDGDGAFNHLDGARGAVFSGVSPDTLVVTALADDCVTFIDTAGTASAGLVVDDWLGVGVAKPQAALHVRGGLVVENPGGLVELDAERFELGRGVSATGIATFASGKDTTASGDYATATGRNTSAGGSYSFTMGRGTVAPSAYEVALGRYNTEYTPDTALGWDVDDRLLVIGNGTGLSARSDLLVLYKSGLLDFEGSLDLSGDVLSGGQIEGATLISGGGIVAAGDIEANSVLASGDVEADSVVASGDFEYSATKTGYVQVPGLAFKAGHFRGRHVVLYPFVHRDDPVGQSHDVDGAVRGGADPGWGDRDESGVRLRRRRFERRFYGSRLPPIPAGVRHRRGQCRTGLGI